MVPIAGVVAIILAALIIRCYLDWREMEASVPRSNFNASPVSIQRQTQQESAPGLDASTERSGRQRPRLLLDTNLQELPDRDLMSPRELHSAHLGHRFPKLEATAVTQD